MATAIRWIIGILIVAAIVWLLWWSGLLGGTAVSQIPPAATSTPSAAVPQNGMSAANDTSDAALTQDAAAIDAQLGGLSSDSANIDSSLTDTPVQQSY